MSKSKKDGGSDDYFYTAYITLRNGRRLYAWQKGLRAFRIPVKKPEKSDSKPTKKKE